MAKVKVGDTRLNSRRLGRGNDTTVLMIHGLLVGNLAAWYFTLGSRLSDQHQVVLYDLRGHGRSDRPSTGYGLASMVADAEAVLAHHGIERCAVVGHSYGGLIGLELARKRPDLVERLVVCDAPLPPSLPIEFEDPQGATHEEILAALPPELASVQSDGSTLERRLLNGFLDLLSDTDILAELQATPDFDDADLATIATPTCLVYGTDSDALDAGHRLSRVLPDAEFHTVEGGHFVVLSAPDAVAEHITPFLARQRAAGSAQAPVPSLPDEPRVAAPADVATSRPLRHEEATDATTPTA